MGVASAALGLLAPLSWFGICVLNENDTHAEVVDLVCYETLDDYGHGSNPVECKSVNDAFMCNVYEDHSWFNHPNLEDECPVSPKHK